MSSSGSSCHFITEDSASGILVHIADGEAASMIMDAIQRALTWPMLQYMNLVDWWNRQHWRGI